MSTRRSLSPIFNSTGLSWSDRVLGYSDDEHHPIGGNSAAHYHIRRQINPESQIRREKRMTPEKLSYYKDRFADLRLDDKFRVTLRDGLFEHITAMPKYEELCRFLDYDTTV